MRLVAGCFSLVGLLLREATTTTATTITQMQPEPASAGAHVLPSPFEQPERCRPQGSSAAAAAAAAVVAAAVCDPWMFLPAHERDIIEESLGAMAATQLAQGAVAIVDTLGHDDGPTPAEAAARAAKATYAAWGVGQRAVNDTGFLVFVSVSDRRCYIAVGEGLEAALPPHELAAIADGVKAALRAGTYGQAILVAVLEIKLLLALVAEEPSKAWNAGTLPPPEQLVVVHSGASGPPSPPSPPSPRPPLRRRLPRPQLLVLTAVPLLARALAPAAVRRVEGALALRAIVADSQRFATDGDDAIVSRTPTRCPQCLGLFTDGGNGSSSRSNSEGDTFHATAAAALQRFANAYLGTDLRPRCPPAALPCGHIFCVSCVRLLSHNAVPQRNNNSDSVDAAARPTPRWRMALRRMGPQRVQSAACPSCPVCATAPGDWAATLNSVHVDSAEAQAVLQSSVAGAGGLQAGSNTKARVEALLARINRNKEVAYAAVRLREEYGVVAAFEEDARNGHHGADRADGGRVETAGNDASRWRMMDKVVSRFRRKSTAAGPWQ